VTLTTRRLGRTDMDITRVGFGAWAIGGSWAFGWGEQDDRESVAAIRHAVDSGINWIDTAATYGLGHSEEVVGRALRDMDEAERPYVFTKCGLTWEEGADPSAPPSFVMAQESVRRELDASLRRLGVERIDLYQVHWPPRDGTPLEDYWATMVALRDEGKVRAIGLSNHDVAALERAEAIGHVDSLQPPFSAIARSAADEIAWCRAHETGVIVYSPMQSGLLTGAFSAERVASLPEDDWRRQDREFTTGLDANLALADALADVAARRGVSTAAVAVAWTLAWPGVTAAIVGARRPEQLDDWIGAPEVELTDAELDEIAAAIERTGAGAGPARA
jgi:aryl-alcohol dehydrogenase-like predicted oxidoreductase